MAAPPVVKIEESNANDPLRLLKELCDKVCAFGKVHSSYIRLTLALVQLKIHLDLSQVLIDDEWIPYMVRLFPANTTERIIVFKPKPPVKVLGCIRVRKDPDKVLWEVHQVGGVYLGFVPVGCSFEAMSVEVKFITPREQWG